MEKPGWRQASSFCFSSWEMGAPAEQLVPVLIELLEAAEENPVRPGEYLLFVPAAERVLTDSSWWKLSRTKISRQLSPDERYVRVATGLDSRGAAPLSGIRMGAGDESMIVALGSERGSAAIVA